MHIGAFRSRFTPAGLGGAVGASSILLAAPGCNDPTEGAGVDDFSHIRFVDRAAETGVDLVNVCGDPRRWYIPESNGSGAAWLDYDEDGDMDLFVANGGRFEYVDDGKRLETRFSEASQLYRNDGGWQFQDVHEFKGDERRAWVNAVAVGDVDNDGDPDAYLACFGRDRFVLRKKLHFEEHTDDSGLSNELWGAGASFGDADRDGALDLYVANYCRFDTANPPDGGRRHVIDGVEVAWGPEGENERGFNPGAPDRFFLGNGKGDFSEATRSAGLELDKDLCSYAVVFADVDDDGWPDILVANDLQPSNLFMNQGGGKFADEGLERGFAYNADGQPTSAMGLMVEDIDQDGDPDVLRTNFDLEPNSLHINNGEGEFSEQAAVYGLAEPSWDRLGWGGGFFDADLDGDFDLLVANGHVYPQAEEIGLHPWAQQSQIYEGLSDDRLGVVWREVTARAGPGLAPLRSSRGAAFGDADDDGDLDVVLVDIDEPLRLLENRTVRQGRWLAVRTVGSFSNRDGIGAKITVRAGDKVWTREVRRTNGLYSSHDPRVLFGLGKVDKVDRVEVRWPRGGRDIVERPVLDQVLIVKEAKATHR